MQLSGLVVTCAEPSTDATERLFSSARLQVKMSKARAAEVAVAKPYICKRAGLVGVALVAQPADCANPECTSGLSYPNKHCCSQNKLSALPYHAEHSCKQAHILLSLRLTLGCRLVPESQKTNLAFRGH
jgi:hypothetical protein